MASQWVRTKCEFGCSDDGSSVCPPNTPTVENCEKFFNEYDTAIAFKLKVTADKTNYPSAWSKQITRTLIDLERQIFLMGFPKTFLLNQTCCSLCKSCVTNRLECKDKSNARPSPEGFAVDVFQSETKKKP